MVGESGVFGPVLASGGDRSFIPEGDLDSSPRDLPHSPPKQANIPALISEGLTWLPSSRPALRKWKR